MKDNYPNLNRKDRRGNFLAQQGSGGNLNGISFTEELFYVMRMGQHPPHLADQSGFDGRTSTPTFLFCWYDRETKEDTGTPAGPYGER